MIMQVFTTVVLGYVLYRELPSLLLHARTFQKTQAVDGQLKLLSTPGTVMGEGELATATQFFRLIVCSGMQ
jgi:hypothetical protein